MKYIKIISAIFITLFVTGCVSTQQPVLISDSFLTNKNATIGILRTEVPLAETVYTGSIGLLDYGIISAVNSGLDKHLKQLSFEEFEQFHQSLETLLIKKGFTVKLIDEPMPIKKAEKLKMPAKGISKDNFQYYQDLYALDYLLLLDMKAIGTTRSYYGPVPTSEPVAQTRIIGQIIDLNTKKLEWYKDATTQVIIESPWDESKESYPNLTNSVYQSLNNALRVLRFDVDNTNAETASQGVSSTTTSTMSNE